MADSQAGERGRPTANRETSRPASRITRKDCMKTDVRTLIVALTTERDALTRAIAALQAIGSTPQPVTPPRPMRPMRRAARSRYRIDPDTKLALYSAMAAAENRSEMARSLSK